MHGFFFFAYRGMKFRKFWLAVFYHKKVSFFPHFFKSPKSPYWTGPIWRLWIDMADRRRGSISWNTTILWPWRKDLKLVLWWVESILFSGAPRLLFTGGGGLDFFRQGGTLTSCFTLSDSKNIGGGGVLMFFGFQKSLTEGGGDFSSKAPPVNSPLILFCSLLSDFEYLHEEFLSVWVNGVYVWL